MVTLARWVKAGHMTKQEALLLVDSDDRPEVMLRKAAQQIAERSRASDYQGAGDRALQPRLAVPSDREQGRVQAALEKRASTLLKDAVRNRHLTPEQVAQVKKRSKSAAETISLVNAILEQKARGPVAGQENDNTYNPADFNLQTDGALQFNGARQAEELIDICFDEGPEL